MIKLIVRRFLLCVTIKSENIMTVEKKIGILKLYFLKLFFKFIIFDVVNRHYENLIPNISTVSTCYFLQVKNLLQIICIEIIRFLKLSEIGHSKSLTCQFVISNRLLFYTNAMSFLFDSYIIYRFICIYLFIFQSFKISLMHSLKLLT